MRLRSAARLTVGAALVAALALQGGPAVADSTVRLTRDIRVGNSGTLGGTATFVRTMRSDGTEVLLAQAHLLRPSVESSICISPKAFTHRQDWSTCPQKTEQTTEVSYTLALGSAYVGSVVHVQFRVRMPEFPDKPGLANGYTGWRAPSGIYDQYGEVAIGPTSSATPSPSPSPSPTTSPSPSPSPSPSATPSATGSPSSSPSPSAAPSGVAGTSGGPVPGAVNAGSGGGAAPGTPVLPLLLLLSGLGLAAEAARRLGRR